MMFEKLKFIACHAFGVSKAQIEGKSRKIEVVYAKIAMSKVLYSQGYKIVDIAGMLNMNHSTITHYFQTFDDRLKYDSKFRKLYEQFIQDCDE